MQKLVDAIESASPLDAPGKQIGKTVRNAISPGAAKDALSGTWLGHAVHPMLTDVVIGSFLSATLLDLLGTEADSGAQERLIAVGIAAYAPTALTGVNDWADSEPVDDGVRRAGPVPAPSNSIAPGPYGSSLPAP